MVILTTCEDNRPATSGSRQDLRMRCRDTHHQVSKERIAPGKPRTRINARIVCIEGLMHEASSSICVHQHPQTVRDFARVPAGQCPHDDGEWPDHSWTHVRASNAFGHATEKVMIVSAEGKCPRALVNWILDFTAAEIGEREQAWCIGIVHHQRVPEAINLKCINPAISSVIHDSMFFDC